MVFMKTASCTIRRITSSDAAPFFQRELKHISQEFEEQDIVLGLASWTLVGLFAEETLVGIIGCDADSSTHIHIVKAWQHLWQVRSNITRALSMLFYEHEQLSATVPKANQAALKLCRLVGGQQISDDGKDVTFILSKSDLKSGMTYQT